MGHANLKNLSDLFVNLLYAKGKISIDDAIATAIKRKETVHASEDEYEDEGMLSMAFGDVVSLLASLDGVGWRKPNNQWEGPWILPDFRWSVKPKGVVETADVTNLLRQCAMIAVETPRLLLDNVGLFGVCADAIQELGEEKWAEKVRSFPRQKATYTAYFVKHEYSLFDDLDNYMAFDAIKWEFAPGWRKKYKDVPRVGNVTH